VWAYFCRSQCWALNLQQLITKEIFGVHGYFASSILDLLMWLLHVIAGGGRYFKHIWYSGVYFLYVLWFQMKKITTFVRIIVIMWLNEVNVNVHNIRNDVRAHIACSYIIIRMYMYAPSVDSAMRIVRILHVTPMDCTAKKCSMLPKRELEEGKMIGHVLMLCFVPWFK
jgi:hypothetical protein